MTRTYEQVGPTAEAIFTALNASPDRRVSGQDDYHLESVATFIEGNIPDDATAEDYVECLREYRAYAGSDIHLDVDDAFQWGAEIVTALGAYLAAAVPLVKTPRLVPGTEYVLDDTDRADLDGTRVTFIRMEGDLALCHRKTGPGHVTPMKVRPSCVVEKQLRP